jgi:hypothetical protein
MQLLREGRVWCDTSVDSCQAWIDEDGVSAGPVCRDLLRRSQRFSLHAQPEVVDVLVFLVHRGLCQLRSGEIDVYSICPVRAEGFEWMPVSNRLSVQAVAALWTLVSDRVRGEVSPLLFNEIPRQYYHSVLGRFVEADLTRSMNGWRRMPRELAEPRISQAVLRSFRKLSQLLPLEIYQDRARELVQQGREPGTIYRDLRRDILDSGERLVRHLLPEPVSVR